MTNEEAIKWLQNLTNDIGQLRHEDLWHYSQALSEIAQILDEKCSNDSDLISRQAAKNRKVYSDERHEYVVPVAEIDWLPSAQPEQRWIPCSSGNLPQTTDPVNITWVNREPHPYYSHIKDVPFTATGHYHNGKWWWYSATCKDYLDEYGESEVDRVDDGIEILAWQPLPPAYDGEKS